MTQAVIMAGGKGTRLLSLTKDEIPKPMVPILRKPLLQWQIECLCREGIQQILIITGHLGNKISDYFGDGSFFNVSISYYQENQPLGTAGALSEVYNSLEDEFLLVFGDILFDVDLERIELFHKQKKSLATLLVHPNSHPFDSDLIVKDRANRIVGFLPKGIERNVWYENCVNAGFYILKKQICQQIPRGKKVDLEKDILFPLIQQGEKIYAYASPEYIKDVGTPQRILSAEQELKQGIVASRNLKNRQRCVFLDRDGTLNQYKGLISNPDDLELEATAAKAVEKLNRSGWLAIVVTNQPVVARGMCEIKDVWQIHKKLQTILGENGAYLDDIGFCPHHPDKGYPEENSRYKVPCSCRKPNPGLLLDFAKKYHIDLERSWMIGDTTVDIQTGINAGTHTALVGTGLCGMDGKYPVCPEYKGETLLEVVDYILQEDQ